ncbi:putative type VI secretion system effector [Acerihabitans sp. TG2]|uniref:putative type VI secretion system effector n=1 Tax=Acerihabitans sp. TG2 TaxID=3096008 RepID=UPI002B230E53|nr:putative type VI secretion system effector [Acerihabitans sp. TG2]MEA9393584.1 putative type VI secretion system effector [Acerihabitans sp. TG2]
MNKRRNRSDFLDFDKIAFELMKSKELVERTSYRTEDMRKEALLAEKNIPALEEVLKNIPPPPVLPAKKKLIKITGILNDLRIMKVKGYFEDREYDLQKARETEDREQVGALILSVIGNTTGAAVTAQNETRMSDLCDFVRGKINGIDFHGWLGLTSLEDGDYVEMAVSPDDGFYVVYAIKHPEKRTISMTPLCKHGVIASSTEGMDILVYFFMFVSLLIFAIGLFKESLLEDILLFEFIYIIAVCLLLTKTRKDLIKKPSPTTQFAEAIFIALGFENPSAVDLEKTTKKILKELNEEKLYDRKDADGRPLPGKDAWREYLYYY